MVKVTCEKELGSWTIRVNGYYIINFLGGLFSDHKAKARAFEVAMRLKIALEKE